MRPVHDFTCDCCGSSHAGTGTRLGNIVGSLRTGTGPRLPTVRPSHRPPARRLAGPVNNTLTHTEMFLRFLVIVAFTFIFLHNIGFYSQELITVSAPVHCWSFTFSQVYQIMVDDLFCEQAQLFAGLFCDLYFLCFVHPKRAIIQPRGM